MRKVYYAPELYHHGVKGMKWGVRKDRNKPKRKYRLVSTDYDLDNKRDQRRRVATAVGASAVAGMIGSGLLGGQVGGLTEFKYVPTMVASILGGTLGAYTVSELFFGDVGFMEVD